MVSVSCELTSWSLKAWHLNLKLVFNQHVKMITVCAILKLKKLKPDKFFMGRPSQNYGVSLPKYGVAQFYLQPEISEHTQP